MLWIKRNLFLVVFGTVAVALLGVGSYYVYSAIQKNAAVEGEVGQKKSDLERLYSLDPFPNRTNIDNAKREKQRVQDVIGQAQKLFAPVPYEKVTGLAFKTRFDETVAELHKLADQAGVKLPPSKPTMPYPFSFDHQQNKVTFAAGSFPTLAEQLAEIRALCLALFDARINTLIGVKRAPTADDPAGGGVYLGARRHTNAESGVAVSPYELTFQCFSAELGAAIDNLTKSTNGFIIKTITVEPIAPTGNAPGLAPAPVLNPRQPPNAPPPPGQNPRLPPPGPSAQTLQTVINEAQRKVTLLVDVVKTIK